MEVTISAPIKFHDEYDVEYRIDNVFAGIPIDKVIYDNDDDMISIITVYGYPFIDILNKVIELVGLCHHDGCCSEVKVVSFKD